MRAQRGNPAVQIRVDASLIPPAGDYLTVAGFPPMFLSFSTYTATGVGGIVPEEKVTVTGHSLGGHLAYMAARLFPEVVNAQVYVYNAAGYDPSTADFITLGGAVGVSAATAAKLYLGAEFGAAAIGILTFANQLTESALSQIVTALRGTGAAQGAPVVVNLRTEDIVPGDDTSVVASRITGADRYPTPIDMPSEANSHVIEPFMDALALHALLYSLNSSLSPVDMRKLLMATSPELVRSEERLTEALRKLTLNEGGELPVSDALRLNKIGKGNIDARAAFHDVVLRIEEAIKDKGFLLDLLLELPPAGIANLAQSSEAIAYRYALKELNPFAVIDVSGKLYERFLPNGSNAGELDLYVPADRTGTLTEDWIKDRAALLQAVVTSNTQDNPDIALIPGSSDISTQYHYYAGGPERVLFADPIDHRAAKLRTQVVMFSDDAGRSLTGFDFLLGDRLYGGGANDVLQGKRGNDYLEGGSGNDTYVWNTGDGFDTILDTDGIGRLLVNGKVVSGGIRVAQNDYVSEDKQTLHFEGDPVSGGVLIVNGDLRIENFTNADLGIVLNNQGSVAEIQPTVTTFHAPFATGTGFGTDGPDNYTAHDGSFFSAKGGDDLFEGKPLSFFDGFFGDAGDDLLIGRAVSSHLVGGSGRDIIFGGPGTDYMSGDFQGAYFAASRFGVDLFEFFDVSDTEPRARGYFNNNLRPEQPDKDIYFPGGYFEALRYVLGINEATDLGTHYDDYLDGGDESDLIIGGYGSDVMFGGEGNDIMDGEGVTPIIDTNWNLDEFSRNSIAHLFGRPGDDYLDGGPGDDQLVDQDSGNEMLIGGDGNDVLTSYDPPSAESYVNYLFGDEGDDRLLSENLSANGFDVLVGGPGNDRLTVQSGSADLEGGQGNDLYFVEYASVTKVIINDFDAGTGGTDRLRVTLSNPVSAVSITRDESNLYVNSGGDPDWITVENWFSGPEYKIEQIIFDNLTTPGFNQIYDVAAIESRFMTTTAAADFLWGSSADEQLASGLGTDTLFGNAGNDILAGNEGNDTLDGGEGADVYVFNVGDGVDHIHDSGSFDADDISFGAGITPDMLTLGLGSLLINIGGNGDAIHLDSFNPNDARNSGDIEYFQFADGTTLSFLQLLDRGFDLVGTNANDVLAGTSVSDRIDGLEGDDTLGGGAGNDVLRGAAGNDTYIFGLGSGIDTIDDGIGDIDSIVLGGPIAPESVTVTRAGDFLTLGINDADRLVIRWQPQSGYQIEQVRFTDGMLWDVTTLEAMAASSINTAPTVANPLVDQTVQEDAPFNFNVPEDTFSDTDSNDILEYSAALTNGDPLPAWLSFDSESRQFAGTPTAKDVGEISIRVTATDLAGTIATDEFQLLVADDGKCREKILVESDDYDHRGHDHGERDHEHRRTSHGRKYFDRDDDRTEHRKPDLAGLLEAYLARRPEYDFEALSLELEHPDRNGEALDAREIARRWQRIDQYMAGLANERDEDSRLGAGDLRLGEGVRGAGILGGGLGYVGSIGAVRRNANFETLQGLEEGFHRLRD